MESERTVQIMHLHERIGRVFNDWARKLYITIGHDIFRNGGLKLTPLTFFWYGIIVSLYLGGVYTVIVSDFITILSVLPYLGINTQVTTAQSCNQLV